MTGKSCFNCKHCEIMPNKRVGKCTNSERKHVQVYGYQIVFETGCCGDYYEKRADLRCK